MLHSFACSFWVKWRNAFSYWLIAIGYLRLLLWLYLICQVNQKAAEALADPEEYPNLFEHWQVACAVESRVAEERGGYLPASEYVNHADRSTTNLVEAFSNMRMYEEPLDNGDMDHEVAEQSGDEVQELGQDDAQNEGEEEGQEEPVVVDADSTDGAVLVNGTEAEEEWVRILKENRQPKSNWLGRCENPSFVSGSIGVSLKGRRSGDLACLFPKRCHFVAMSFVGILTYVSSFGC